MDLLAEVRVGTCHVVVRTLPFLLFIVVSGTTGVSRITQPLILRCQTRTVFKSRWCL
jgi:hypothetical protein